MAPLPIFEKSSAFDGIYVVFTVNRMQILYFLLIMPGYLVQPYMVWGILAAGILSQLNLLLLAKLFSSFPVTNGDQEVSDILGKRTTRLFAFLGPVILLVKIPVLTLGMSDIVHQYIFPSMNASWIVLFIFLVCFYLASQGIEKTIRFVVVVFFSTFWMLIVFIPFFFPPAASLHNMYPLIPTEGEIPPLKSLLFLISAFSGPEFIVFLAPWFKPRRNMLKYLSIANTISVTEYLFLFAAAILFFGSNYLSKTTYPIVYMISYLQFPVFERIDSILISMHLFIFIFVAALFILLFYAAVRSVLNMTEKKPKRLGFAACWFFVLAAVVAANEWLWKTVEVQSLWINLEIYSRVATFLCIPAALFTMTKLRERKKA